MGRIETRQPQGRENAGEGGYSDEKAGHGGKSEWVSGGYAVNQVGEETGGKDGKNKAADHTGDREEDAGGGGFADDVARRGSESEANSHFTGALRHRLRDQSIDADGGEKNRETGQG